MSINYFAYRIIDTQSCVGGHIQCYALNCESLSVCMLHVEADSLYHPDDRSRIALCTEHARSVDVNVLMAIQSIESVAEFCPAQVCSYHDCKSWAPRTCWVAFTMLRRKGAFYLCNRHVLAFGESQKCGYNLRPRVKRVKP